MSALKKQLKSFFTVVQKQQKITFEGRGGFLFVVLFGFGYCCLVVLPLCFLLLFFGFIWSVWGVLLFFFFFRTKIVGDWSHNTFWGPVASLQLVCLSGTFRSNENGPMFSPLWLQSPALLFTCWSPQSPSPLRLHKPWLIGAILSPSIFQNTLLSASAILLP